MYTAPCLYQGREYYPISPKPDTGELLQKCSRLMLRHDHDAAPTIFWADKGVLTAGWVIGLDLQSAADFERFD